MSIQVALGRMPYLRAMRPRVLVPVVAFALLAVSCADGSPPPEGERDVSLAVGAEVGPSREAVIPAASVLLDRHAAPRPAWLGTRVLPLRPDGLGQVRPTPPELVDRQLATPAHLPPPEGDDFVAQVGPVPDDVAARSTWGPHCPVAREDLRYATVTFWGFDGRHHTGEMIAHADAVDDLVAVFARLHEIRFPIEEMRVVAADELDLPPTGDGNNTTVFVCRPTVTGSRWSEHAYGRAVDINPFHNPYVRGEIVVPELASAYADRGWRRPGMIVSGDAVVEAFAAVGWLWGGDWESASDPMHFSPSGR
jgi:hypothetical protein